MSLDNEINDNDNNFIIIYNIIEYYVWYLITREDYSNFLLKYLKISSRTIELMRPLIYGSIFDFLISYNNFTPYS